MIAVTIGGAGVSLGVTTNRLFHDDVIERLVLEALFEGLIQAGIFKIKGHLTALSQFAVLYQNE